MKNELNQCLPNKRKNGSVVARKQNLYQRNQQRSEVVNPEKQQNHIRQLSVRRITENLLRRNPPQTEQENLNQNHTLQQNERLDTKNQPVAENLLADADLVITAENVGEIARVPCDYGQSPRYPSD